jgi:uncharacterized protein (DUF1800 family)
MDMKRKAVLFILAAVSFATLSTGAAAPKLTEDQKILHLLNRIGFGPRPGDIDRVRKIGATAYLESQLFPDRIDDSDLDALLASFPSVKMTQAEIDRKYVQPNKVARKLGVKPPNPEVRKEVQAMMQQQGMLPPQRLLQELQGQKIVRAVESERQLQEVMTDFWFNHFNVFWGKGQDKQLTTDYEMNAIRPHVLGKFKDLVMATAKSPAMLFYLDNAQSSSPNMKLPAQQRLDTLERQRMTSLNPRQQERLQQQIDQIRQRMAQAPKGRTPGINENYARELMELHTLGVDGGYSQKDVQEVARAFTGWTIDRQRQNAAFTFREPMHDKGEKIVLGHKINAGGIRDGEEVIDILVHHPSTAHFIATKLVRRFVSDEPPASLVDRVAAVYMKTDGDIREMLRTIFTSDEFYSPEAYRAKTKSPFELVVSAIRALDGSTNGGPRLAQEIARMGQPLYQYQPPTGFPDRASEWTSSGSLVERLNFGVALSANRMPGATIDLTRFSDGSTQPESVVERATQVLLGGDVSDKTKNILIDQVRSSTEPPLVKAFALVLGSPEFQKR